MFGKYKVLAIGLAVIVVVVLAHTANREFGIVSGHGRAVDAVIAKNVEARGGADAWRAVSSLRLAGYMDLGQGMAVPYTLEQKRPGRMCLEFEFNDEMATQCVNAGGGWKLLPFRGREIPEPMSAQELREMADAAEIDGLLFDSARRGHDIELVGHEQVDGRDAVKLAVTLPGGAERSVYLDAETGLEIKIESMRVLRGEERLVETYLSDWRATDGLLIPRRQETRTAGDAESHFLSVDSVTVNPAIDDARFEMPISMNARNATVASNAS